jgi:TonB family protein
MTTTAQQFAQGSLQLRFNTPSSSRNPQAWKNMMGSKPVSARFDLLPDNKPRAGAMGTSVILQICLVTVVVILPLLFPQQMIPKAMSMVTDLAGPPLDVPEPPKPKPPAPPKAAKVQPPPPPPIERPAPPKLDAAKYFAPPKETKPKPREVAMDLPKVDETFQPMNMKVEDKQPVRPRDPVKTGLMSTGSSATPTITKPTPVEKVQTGGFGDPNGIAGPSNPNKRATIGQFGDPALPAGPGYGNGTGGATGQRGVVASTGFGNGTAIAPTEKKSSSVQTAGFSNSNDVVALTPKKKTEDAPSVEPVVILDKPKPVYTQEAIKLNLEGEVLLEVVFPASGGQVQVNRVVKGLGHGLDEAATRAAQLIKFKPALSNGHPVDFPAVVHIVFQIAY